MIQIPAFILFAAALAVLMLVGGLIHSVYRLSARVAATEERETDLRSHVIRLEGILYQMNPNAFRSDE